MASCITSTFGSATSPRIRLTVVESGSTDTVAKLKWTLEFIVGYPPSTSVNKNYKAIINGTTVKSGSYDINGKNGTYTIASGTHNVNKTTSAQSISFSCSMDFNINWSGTWGYTKSASGSISIPAKTKYTVSYNANGGSGAPSNQTKWHGTAITLSSTKPTRAGHTFKGWATSSSGSVAYAAGASYTANATVTLYAVWEPYTYKVTYNANGGSGAPSSQTKTYGVTLKLSTTKPTRTNYTFLGWATSSSATTATYSAGANYTANAAVTLYAVWKLAYTPPKITKFSVDRCDTDGTLNDEGVNALVKFDWSTFQEVTSIVIEGRTENDIQFNIPLDSSEFGGTTSGTVNVVVGDDSLSTDSTYSITVTVKDKYGTNATRTLNGAIFAIDFLAGGKGAAVGKPAELEDYFDVGFKTRFRNDVEFNDKTAIYVIDSEGASWNMFEPMDENGDTIIGRGHYDMLDGDTYIYGYDVFLRPDFSRAFRPYVRIGDVMTFKIRTAGYVTNGGKDVSFTIPFTVPIVGDPVATISNTFNFTLRQGSQYTHGSTANSSTMPDSYSTFVDMYCGVHITAHFTDTTNVTNNDSIGIYWNGTITFS